MSQPFVVYENRLRRNEVLNVDLNISLRIRES